MDNFYDENFRRQLSASARTAETISNAMKPTIQQIKILNEAISPLKINSEYARKMTGAISKGLPSPYLLNEIKNVNRRNDYLIKNNQLISQYVKNCYEFGRSTIFCILS
ncbi:hypothetical protein [Lactobacillus terrae]|uniref:hypothetical protein n=1 Tax=Lactobacillus terrae TaxID=2269374 RepID=UPI000C1B751D|nr:hypothetical protein [Lactobacillus terrae]